MVVEVVLVVGVTVVVVVVGSVELVVVGSTRVQSVSAQCVRPVSTVRATAALPTQRPASTAWHFRAPVATRSAQQTTPRTAARRLVQKSLAGRAQRLRSARRADHATDAAAVGAALPPRRAVERAARTRRLHRRAHGVEIAPILRRAAALEARVPRPGDEAVAVLVDVVAGQLAGAGMTAGVAIVAVVGEVGAVLVLVAGERATDAEGRQVLRDA
jgi:hypothetical protein